MVHEKIKTSVALCTYNGEKYIEAQLESILEQSVPVDEVVIFDDRSSDNTLPVIQQFAEKFPNIFKVSRNESNIGYVRNFEKAVMECSGDLIFLCDQDDVWKINKVEKILEETKKNPLKNVFCHDLEILKEDGEVLHTSFWNSPGFLSNYNNKQVLEYLLFEKNVFPGMTLALTKSARDQYFPLKKLNKTLIHDYEVILKACSEGGFMIIPEVLAQYRLHPNQNIGFGSLEKNEINKNEIYLQIKRITFVEDTVNQLDLEPSLLTTYIEKCKVNYQEYIVSLRFPYNIITHFKMKYYYKVLNFSSNKNFNKR